MAVAIDAVRVGAASWTNSGSGVAGAGAETSGGLTGGGAAGVAVAIDAVRVGAPLCRSLVGEAPKIRDAGQSGPISAIVRRARWERICPA